MEKLFWFVPIGSIIALLYAYFLGRSVYKYDEGTEEMKKIAEAVREGAYAYLKRQYAGVAVFFGVVFVILMIIALNGLLPIFVPFAFLTGGFFSGLSGYLGMTQAVHSSARTANAARKSLNSALRVAFNAGAVMGFVVVGLGILDLSIWYIILNWYYRNLPVVEKIRAITSTMICFGMGASSQALFARVGGGIFTKAADVGADLVGKVEAGIPEDDPRNPAVIADNVGDNVGDVAGMGADLYESYVGSIIATMALAVAAGLGINGVLVPMLMATVGILSSIIGTWFVRTKEEISQLALLTALRRGIWISSVAVAVFSFLLIKFLLPQYMNIFFALFAGLVAGVLIGFSTEFFTSDTYKPTRSISYSAKTGPATVFLQGIGVGMFSTVPPVVIVVIAVIIAYYVSGGLHNFNLGLYGVSIAAVGMLSTLGITLATDAYGPVADNAGGNAQMSHLPPEVRERTDALDALGNTTAATGKGFAIGSAALTALALLAAYKDQIEILGGKLKLEIINPPVLLGIMIGACMPYAFSSMTLRAVSQTAGKIVEEVRRQFREIKGLMEGTAKADYARAVKICIAAAQKEMVAPSLTAILMPIVIGILLGPSGVIGLLAGALSSGFIVAVMMANSGGAWDNAKKYIEKGNLGGKGTDVHKAAVIGDTVGDPFKDTAGPSLNILIKLMSTVSIVFARFVLAFTLFKW